MHDEDDPGNGQIPGEESLPPKSLAQRIWENKWTWAVGRTWTQHSLNMGVYLALITYLLKGREPPAAILERIGANWSPWQMGICSVVYTLLATLPAFLTLLYLIYCLTVGAFHQAVRSLGKLADYFGADIVKGFCDHVVEFDPERHVILNLTPQGGLLPIWVLFLFWPLTIYQWCLAGAFAAVALCLSGFHRFDDEA